MATIKISAQSAVEAQIKAEVSGNKSNLLLNIKTSFNTVTLNLSAQEQLNLNKAITQNFNQR